MSNSDAGQPGFGDFFAAATGRAPADYLRRLAEQGLTESITVPGDRAEVVLAWLWRRLRGPDRAATPRRLIYALPQHSLAEPTAERLGGWLDGLDLADAVALHVVMGGSAVSGSAVAGPLAAPQWRRDMHRPAIVIGTADVLVSKALNRGFGVGPNSYPIDFALTTNGAQWIFADAGLCRQTLSTMRDIARLSAAHGTAHGTAEPFGVSAVSPGGGHSVRAQSGRCSVRRLGVAPGDYPAIAAAAARRHRPGNRTLIVLNTVAAARQVYEALAGCPVSCLLVHSRFRGRERAALARALGAEVSGDGQIVVSTQVAEVGLDLAAALVVTEAAPWHSVMLRARQCGGGAGESEAELLWVPPAQASPYEAADIAASVAALSAPGEVVTSADLAGLRVPTTEPALAELGTVEISGLFDTEPGLDGADLDFERYVRDADDLDAQLIWAAWAGAGPPPGEAKIPSGEWRCWAPVTRVDALAARVPVWRLDRVREGWTALTPGERIRPGEILLVAAADGGYDPVLGFDPALPGPVADVPSADPLDEPVDEPVADKGWVSLRRHGEETRDQAAGLIAATQPAINPAARRAVLSAAYLHDVGKAHPIWQDALCALASEGDRARIEAGRPWAKSGTNGPLEFAGNVTFRHELASLLLIDGPLRALTDLAADRDLLRYLVLAHHGRLRVQVRDPDPAPGALLGLKQGAVSVMPSGFGGERRDLTTTRDVTMTVDLGQFSDDGDNSWKATVSGLLDRYGPFVLAYLETVVRIADWRSSGGVSLP